MKCHIWKNNLFQIMMAFVAAIMLSMPDAMAGDKVLTKADLQNMYMNYLSSEGYSPKVDSDGDVRFKNDEHTFFISIDEGDPNYLRIVMPNIWPIESDEETLRALVASDFTNHKIKVVKLFMCHEHTWASIESFVGEPEQFIFIFKRSMSALEGGAMTFARKMHSMNRGQHNTGRENSVKLPEQDESIGII